MRSVQAKPCAKCVALARRQVSKQSARDLQQALAASMPCCLSACAAWQVHAPDANTSGLELTPP